jgi:glycosyltransferase involved in cell wall biosynthesis
MILSVVVPAYNAAAFLPKSLPALKASASANFELLVVDDGSTDDSRAVAERYAAKVLRHERNKGLVAARMTGLAGATGDIIVNVDADVVVFPDTLDKIVGYFETHPDISAITGRLSKEHANPDFFSQYKNLYMNYIFGKLPERVNFLYGSIHAMRRNAVQIYQSTQNIGEDSERGQRLVEAGKKIAFVRDLEVAHLKKYSFRGWIKNDFEVPYWWARLFVVYKGWKSLGKNKGGYLHSPKEQLASVVIGPLSAFFLTAGIFWYPVLWPGLILKLIWLLLNLDFIAFLWKEKGAWFGIRSILATYFDHIIMAFGIFLGMINACVKSQS